MFVLFAGERRLRLPGFSFGSEEFLGNKWIVIEEPDDILVDPSNVWVPKKYDKFASEQFTDIFS